MIVLDGSPVPQGEGAVSGMVSGIFRHLHPQSFEWAKFREECICLVCEKLAVFPYEHYNQSNHNKHTNETVYVGGERRAVPKLSQRKTMVIVMHDRLMFSNTQFEVVEHISS